MRVHIREIRDIRLNDREVPGAVLPAVSSYSTSTLSNVKSLTSPADGTTCAAGTTAAVAGLGTTAAGAGLVTATAGNGANPATTAPAAIPINSKNFLNPLMALSYERGTHAPSGVVRLAESRAR